MAAQRLGTDIDEYVLAADFGGVAVHSGCRILDDFAAGHVITPAVPGANQGLTLQWALAEGPTPVKAGVVDGVEFAVDVGQGDGLALHLQFPHGSRGYFVNFYCAYESHSGYSVLGVQ